MKQRYTSFLLLGLGTKYFSTIEIFFATITRVVAYLAGISFCNLISIKYIRECFGQLLPMMCGVVHSPCNLRAFKADDIEHKRLPTQKISQIIGFHTSP